MSGGRGGRREGAGRKPGVPNKQTVEIRTIAMQYGPAAIAALATMAGLAPGTPAESEPARIAALKEVLDRAYGRATQPVSGDASAPAVAVEFTWMNASDAIPTTPEPLADDVAIVGAAETVGDC